MEYTGERYVPEISDPQTSYEHWHRYLFASRFVEGKSVLDIACGEGFGSYLLAQTAAKVVGVDIASDAIAHAASKYTTGNLEFLVGSVDHIPIPGTAVFDVIISFETIEHVSREEQSGFLSETRRLLTPDGLFICSTPNKLLYSDLPAYHNEFHVQEYYVHEFREALSGYFPHVRLLGQRVYPVSYIWPEEGGGAGLSEFRLSLTEAGFRPTRDAKELIYAIALCSAQPISVPEASLAVDLTNRLLRVRDEEIGSLKVALADKQDALQAASAEASRLGQLVEAKEQALLSLAAEKEDQFLRLQELHDRAVREGNERSERLQEMHERAVRDWTERSQHLERQSAEHQRTAQALLEEKDGLARDLQKSQGDLLYITSSTSWQMARVVQGTRRLVAPDGSHRHRAYLVVKSGFLVLRKDGPRVFLNRTRQWFSQVRHGTPPPKVETAPLAPSPAKIQPRPELDAVPPMPTGAGSARCRRFVVYASSEGNYFFHEIADLLAAALTELGFQTERRNERQGFDPDSDWHIVTAPHEFFELGAGRELRQADRPANLVLLNTEQPSTQWFALASEMFASAYRIWDMNPLAAQAISELGFPVDYLPLGYVSRFAPFGEIPELPDTSATCFLEPHIRCRSYLRGPLSTRPIDILFVGSLSPRREAFFARAAQTLARHRCYLHLWDPVVPAISGKNTAMDTPTVVGLAQRSQLVLNVHRGTDSYFEWQRMVMHGMWQRALVITEPCREAPPFQAGADFIEAQLDDLPGMLDYYLLSADGRARAQSVVDHAEETLKMGCFLPAWLRDLVTRLYVPVPESQAGFWHPALPKA